MPVPRRSAIRAARTPGQLVARPINGLASAAAMNPTRAIDFRRRSLSESHPETPCTMFWVAEATPSTSPTMLPPALSVSVRNSGSTG